MWLYASSWMMFAASALSLLLLLWMVTGRNPVQELGRAGKFMWVDARFLGALVAAFAMFAIDSVETMLEPKIARFVPWDFTHQIAQYGTGVVHALQRLQWPPLTHALTYVYVVLFPIFMLIAMVVYAANHDWVALKRHLKGYYLNYLVALPFYVFVPVREAWAAHAGIRFLIPTIYPGFEAQYRPYSGLDNCFPSLHTSLALTYALVAWRNGYKRLAAMLTAGAAATMLSTLYLGIHWVPDLLAGGVLAVLASGILPGIAAQPSVPAAASQR
jgi:membrane-associated phospholipid phosphatase